MSTPYLSLNYTQNTAVLRQTLSVTAPTSITASSTSNSMTITQSGTGQAVSVYGAGSSNVLMVRSGADPTAASGGVALTVTGQGNVGMGTATPIQRVHISGTTFLNGNVGIGAGAVSASNPDRALVVSGDTTLAGTAIIGDPLPTGLVASLSFSGHMFEDSGNSNTLVGAPNITGTPQLNTQGRVGTSIVAINPPGAVPTTFLAYPITNNTIGGTESGATLRLSHTHPDGFTIMAWIKPYGTASTNRQFAVGGDGGFNLAGSVSTGSYLIGMGVEPTTNYCFATIQQSAGNYVTVTSTTVASVSAWTHLTLVCSGSAAGSTVSMYINGTSVGTPQSYTTTATSFISKLLLFNAYTGATNAFFGEVDHVQVYNQGLSATQVASAYASTATRAYAPAILANSLRVQGPCQFSPSTALDVFNTNTSNAAMTLQYTTQEYMGFDDSGTAVSSGLTSNIMDYANGAAAASRFGPFPSTLPSEGSFFFDSYSYPGSNSAFLSTPQNTAGSNVYAFNWWQSGGFTAEAWVYQTARPGTGVSAILAHADPLSVTAATTYWALYVNNATGGEVIFSYYNGGTVTINTGTLLALNTWTHVAVSCDGTNIRMFVNGDIKATSAVSGTPVVNFNGNVPIVIGQYGGGNAFQGYISNLRLVRGAAVYTAAFTAPTTPLPRATVTAPATTLLLLRAAQIQRTPLTLSGEGRLSITKLGGAQDTEASRVYPPIAMTANGTLVTSSNVSYGLGYYTAAASTCYGTLQPFNAFDRTGSSWASLTSLYNNTSPYDYNGSVRTQDINGRLYAGEWIQLQLPVSIRLTAVSYVNASGQTGKAPARFFVLGSHNGTSWTLVGQYANQIYSQVEKVLPVNTQYSFSIYRIVVPNVSGSNTVLDIRDILFYGKQESAITVTYPDARLGVGVYNPTQALEVSGNALFGGNISAGNLGMFRNRVINGDMRIAQRGTTLTTSPISTSTQGEQYGCVDRFKITFGITTGGIKQDQTTLSASDTPYQYGHRYAFRLTAQANNSSYGYITISHVIEGYNMTDFNWGTPFGSPITCTFWFRTNVATGSLLSISLRNANIASWYTYNTSITVAAQSQWQFVNVTIPPPPNGSTWNANTNLGGIEFFFAAYTGLMSSSANSWQAANYLGLTTNTNIWATSGNYVEITGLQLEKGTIATPFEFRPYNVELLVCQRYYQTFRSGIGLYCGDGNTYQTIFPFPVPMRISPAMGNSAVLVQGGTFSTGWPKAFPYDNTSYYVEVGMTSAQKGTAFYQIKADAEL